MFSGFAGLLVPVAVFVGLLISGVFAYLFIRHSARNQGLAPAKTPLGQLQRTPPTWGPGFAVDPAHEVRIRPKAPSLPNPLKVAKTMALGSILPNPLPTWRNTRVDALPARLSQAPSESRETGSTVIFDPVGVRLEWPGGLNFAVYWPELTQVSLQVASTEHLQMIRLVLRPVDPGTFAAAHPEMQPLYGGEVGPGAWGISLGTGIKPLAHLAGMSDAERWGFEHWEMPGIDQAAIQEIFRGLDYAGTRFSGQLERVTVETPPQG